MEIPKEYGNSIFKIDFGDTSTERNFVYREIPTPERILLDLAKFVKVFFFIIVRVPGPFLGEFLNVCTEKTITLQAKSKKGNFYFLEKVSFKNNPERKIQQALHLSKKGIINEIVFASPEYFEEICYCHNTYFSCSLERSQSEKSFIDGDIQISNKIFLAYDPPKDSLSGSQNFWTIRVLDKKWCVNSLNNARFHSREMALELILEFLRTVEASFEDLDDDEMERIIGSIEKIGALYI